MAHYIQFGTALVFSVAGLACYLLWSNWIGFAVFIALFIIGSIISSRLFNRYATLDQIKQDLEARLRND